MSTTDIPGGGGPVVPPSTPSSGVDTSQFEAEIARLRAENAQMQGVFQRLEPLADDIQWLQDEEHAKFLRTARQSYEQAAATAAPETKEQKMLEELTGFVHEFKAQQKQAQEMPRLKWLQEGKTFCEDLMRKHPDELSRSADPTLSWTGALENICASRNLTWEEGWKILSPAFVKDKPSAPPPSLRADAGMPGLPPPSRVATPDNTQGKTLGKIVLERMQTQGA